MKKAIFFDIDGTLVDIRGGIHEISERVAKIIKKLQSHGHYVFIATGRPYAFLDDKLKNFGFDGFILANGAQVVIDGETVYSDPIKKRIVNEITAEFEERKIQHILEGDTYSYMKESCREYYAFYDEVGVSREYMKSDYNIEEVDAHKVEVWCPDEATLDICLSVIKRNPECGHFSSINNKIVEIYSKQNTKAMGILKAIEYLNIPVDNTYAFGDGTNDIEMLEFVGCGIAMGNASEEVKKYANEITDSVHNDGVAIGIEKYVIA